MRLVAARTGVPYRALFHTTRTDRAGNTDGFGIYAWNLQDGSQSRVAMLPLPHGQVITGSGQQPALVTGLDGQGERVVYFLPPQVRAAAGTGSLS